MGATQEEVISIIDECIKKFGSESTTECKDRYYAETPKHIVFLDDYWIDKYEITNAMFAAFLNDIGWLPYQSEPYYVWADRMPKIFISYPEDSWVVDEGYENYPIHDVHWQGAHDYCEWAGRRLPTEAEWEKAARGVDGRQYPWGNEEPSSELAHFDWRYVAVDQLPNGVSPYGVFNMVGNVQEWVADWYSSSYYSNSPDLNPSGPRIGTYRVVRGGVDLELQIMRTTFRDYGYIDNTVRSRYGFRCATSSNQ
jgi:iron(II)-dependent oxidoreductase